MPSGSSVCWTAIDGSAAEGFRALVTGASRGIGAAIAIELGRLGAHVVITARRRAVGRDRRCDSSAGGATTLLPLDLHEGGAVDRLGPSIYQRFGRLDVLVHCAGVLGRLTPVSHLMPHEWADAVSVNLDAAMRLIRTGSVAARCAGRGAQCS